MRVGGSFRLGAGSEARGLSIAKQQIVIAIGCEQVEAERSVCCALAGGNARLQHVGKRRQPVIVRLLQSISGWVVGYQRFTFLPWHGNQTVRRRAEGARFTLRVVVLDAER